MISQAVRLRYIKYWVQAGLHTGIYQLCQPPIFLCSAANKDLYFIASLQSLLWCGEWEVKLRNKTEPDCQTARHTASVWSSQFAIKSRILVNSIELIKIRHARILK